MAGKRPAWVDDLEAFLHDMGACSRRRRAALIRVSKLKTYEEAWSKLDNWFDLSWFVDRFDPMRKRRANANTPKAFRFRGDRGVLLRDYLWDRLGARAYQKESCALYRKFWPNPPKLPKAKPVKKGR